MGIIWKQHKPLSIMLVTSFTVVLTSSAAPLRPLWGQAERRLPPGSCALPHPPLVHFLREKGKRCADGESGFVGTSVPNRHAEVADGVTGTSSNWKSEKFRPLITEVGPSPQSWLKLKTCFLLTCYTHHVNHIIQALLTAKTQKSQTTRSLSILLQIRGWLHLQNEGKPGLWISQRY